MQIEVVDVRSPKLLNRVIFPETTVETTQWLEEQFYRGTENLTAAAQTHYQRACELWQSLNNDRLNAMARSLTRTVKGLFHPNAIVPMTTIEDVQKAKPVMQRYMMAHIGIRKLYHLQRCDGYSDSYVDHSPGVVGNDHYDYRRVMGGIVQDYKDDEGNDAWKVVMFADDLLEGDRDPDADEKFLILEGWDLIELALSQKRDPTDIFNGSIE